MNWSGLGAILLGLAVILGAFGAHGLRGRLDAYAMGIYEKAVFYQFVHALGILIRAAVRPGRHDYRIGYRLGVRPAAGRHPDLQR